MKIKKISLKLLPVLICYIATILAVLISGTITKYLMYAVIIVIATLIFATEKKSQRILNEYPYIIFTTLLVIIVSLFAELIGGGGKSWLNNTTYISVVELQNRI